MRSKKWPNILIERSSESWGSPLIKWVPMRDAERKIREQKTLRQSANRKTSRYHDKNPAS